MRVIKPKFPLYLKKVGDCGWGVFCSKRIPKGRVFEVAPIIYIPAKFLHRLTPTPLNEYRFEYRGKSCSLVLGYGMLYNHSSTRSNCEYNINFKSRTYSFYATKEILPHTEICHDYNWDEENYREAGIPGE